MEIFAVIPAGILFLFSLYKLIKDDYVFIRKGVSLEQAFDIAFYCFWISLFFSRIFYLFFHRETLHILFSFFSYRNMGLSMVGGVLGGALGLYIISKSKRLPLGRLSDFLSLSLLVSLPVGYLTGAIIFAKLHLLHLLLSGVLYFVIVLFFLQFLYPKLMNRTLREGSIAILFVVSFCVISLLTSILNALQSPASVLSEQNAIIVLLLFIALGLFVRQERPFMKPRRTLHH